METRKKRPDAAHPSRCHLLEVPASNRNSKKIRIVEQQKPLHSPCHQDSPPPSCFFRAIDDNDLYGETLNVDSSIPSMGATKTEVPLNQSPQCGTIVFMDASTTPHLIAQCPQFPSLSDLDQSLSPPSFTLQPRSMRRPNSWPGDRETRYTGDLLGL
jgi:hypothetical protein